MTTNPNNFFPIMLSNKNEIQYLDQTVLDSSYEWCRDELDARARGKHGDQESETTKEPQSENNDLECLIREVNRVRQDMNAAQLRIECSEKCTLGAVNDNVYVAFKK